jgi:hypothetical protein
MLRLVGFLNGAARREYEEYMRRFPDGARAKEAKTALKRLGAS